jgi:hypothetical protein
MNQLAENAINANTGWKKLGIVFADYPGPGSASTPGLIGSLIAVNQRYSTPKLSQTITFNPNPLPNRTVGDPPFTVAPTSTSTLPVSVTSSTTAVCTVASNSVTIVAAGTCTLNANQAGDSRYLAATQVTRPFTVSKKAQTITFSQVAMQTYGSTWPTVTPSSTSGLFVTVAATTPTCAAVTLDVNNPQTYTIELLGAGTCTLTANQAGNATYLAAPQPDDHLQRDTQREARGRAVWCEPHRDFGLAGDGLLEHDRDLYRFGQHGHGGRAWHLLADGQPDRQRQLQPGHPGHPDLRGDQ